MKPSDFLKAFPGRVIKTQQGYWAFIPNPLPPEWTWSGVLVTLHSEAERELARLSMAGQDFPDAHILSRPFIRNEAVISSRIEGTHATLDDIYSYEATQMSSEEPTSDIREVYNYVRALDYGLERVKSLPISLRLIRELHARLMEGVRGEVMTPGEFRRSQNWIGQAGSTLETASYVPPLVDEMRTVLNTLEQYVHSPSDLPPLTRIGLIHYQFEAIHPFLDGNGRVGRLLISMLLCQWGLLPQPFLNLSAHFDRNRSEYYERLLAISRRGDWESWLGFFLAGIRDQSLEGAVRVQNLQEIRQRYHKMVAGRRSAARLTEVVEILVGNPVITVRSLQAGMGLADFKTVQRYVDDLQEAGILRELTGNKRIRLYRADELFNVIQKPL